jgi:hypothetical protein
MVVSDVHCAAWIGSREVREESGKRKDEERKMGGTSMGRPSSERLRYHLRPRPKPDCGLYIPVQRWRHRLPRHPRLLHDLSVSHAPTQILSYPNFLSAPIMLVVSLSFDNLLHRWVFASFNNATS